MTDGDNSSARGRSIGAALNARLPRTLSRALGPVVRMRQPGDCAFLDHSDDTHNGAMLSLPSHHWDAVVSELGLGGFGSVLDVGCGAGAWLPVLARTNGQVVAVDVDTDALATARTRCAGAANVVIRAMPGESLDFDDRGFDAALCFSTLPYLDEARGVTEMHRVLRPRGRLVLGTVGVGYYAKYLADGIRHDQPEAVRYGLDPILVSAARALTRRRVAPGSLKAWSPRAVCSLLESNGFTVDRVVPSVAAIDPRWPESFLGRPVYFIVFATKRDE